MTSVSISVPGKCYCWCAIFCADTNSFRLSNLEYKLYFRRQSIPRCIPFIHMCRLAIKTMTFGLETIDLNLTIPMKECLTYATKCSAVSCDHGGVCHIKKVDTFLYSTASSS